MQDFEKISVVGLGYIGLPTATILATNQVSVIGVDVNPDTVATINRGEIHIIEPDLDEAVHSAVSGGWLKAVQTAEPADAFLIAVPTPFVREDRKPDLTYIEAASRAIAPVLEAGNLVILESTSPVGATEQMARWLAEERPDLTFPHQAGENSDIRIAHCPERVLPGKVMQELISNDRIVGGATARCANEARKLYEIFVKGECLLTDLRTAEMCKLAENAFRDVNIAYANELSMICDGLNINVWELIRLANHHPRVNILQPGAGVGGHCIAVDPWFIVSSAPKQANLIRTARQTNDAKPEWVMEKVRTAAAQFAKQHNRNPKIAALGLAFKPDIDDLRESPALHIAQRLYEEHGDRLMVVEPNVESLPTVIEGCSLVSLDQALAGADIVVVLVDHAAFAKLKTLELSAGQVIIDAVGLLAREKKPILTEPIAQYISAAE
ncbi:MAG: UDP-N-acetyl-D-mannosamine dehydrogenase [Sphingobium sp.]